MATPNKSNSSLTLAQPANGHDYSSMPEELGAPYQAGYEAGLAIGKETG